MQASQQINAFSQLRDYLIKYLEYLQHPNHEDDYKDLNAKLSEAKIHNGWFTEENILLSIHGIIKLLNPNDIEQAIKRIKPNTSQKTIAIIMAGNIPFVGLHDLLCVLLSGNRALIKLSGDDNILLPFLFKKLIEIEPAYETQVSYADFKLSNFDAVIATGSNNSAAHFHHYFSKYPNIIRKNRNSIAIINGTESNEDLKKLGLDIFAYYGLGCRNVSKLFVPKNYSFNKFFENIFDFQSVIDNKKYANNYEYNRAIYLMGQEKFLDNNFLALKQDSQNLSSPVAVLLYDTYESENEIKNLIHIHNDQIQCVVSNKPIDGIETVLPGNSQSPGFFDYADKVDTLEFINKL